MQSQAANNRQRLQKLCQPGRTKITNTKIIQQLILGSLSCKKNARIRRQEAACRLEQACLFPHLILSNGHWAHYRKQKHRPLEKPGQVLQLAIGHVKLLPKTLHNWQQQLDKKQLELRPSNFPRSPAFSANLVHPFWERSPVKYAPN